MRKAIVFMSTKQCNPWQTCASRSDAPLSMTIGLLALMLGSTDGTDHHASDVDMKRRLRLDGGCSSLGCSSLGLLLRFLGLALTALMSGDGLSLACF